MKIQDSDITVENIDRLIQLFGKEYGVYDEVLIRLFENADNMNHDNIFCRVGLLDLIYSTGIQRFNKGGIETVTNHIKGLADRIDVAREAKDIDYKLYNDLKAVEYADVISTHGCENQIPVFATKFLSFSNPDVYPIMDSVVKRAIGVGESDGYEVFCNELEKFINEKIGILGKAYSLKDIDEFLWMWGKEKNNS